MELTIYFKGTPYKVLYDDCDHEIISKYKWQYHHGYAKAQVWIKGVGGYGLYMHRLILGLKKGMKHVDHINHNPLDNRRCNIRICSHRENMRNSKSRKNSSSKFLGVSVKYKKRDGKLRGPYYQATIGGIYLGHHKTEESAARAYDEAAKKYHGEFANLNFK